MQIKGKHFTATCSILFIFFITLLPFKPLEMKSCTEVTCVELKIVPKAWWDCKYLVLFSNLNTKCFLKCYNLLQTNFKHTFNILRRVPVVYCGTPAPVANGYIVNTTGARYQSQATYMCNPGFTMTGGTTATCTANGQWAPRPLCSCRINATL